VGDDLGDDPQEVPLRAAAAVVVDAADRDLPALAPPHPAAHQHRLGEGADQDRPLRLGEGVARGLEEAPQREEGAAVLVIGAVVDRGAEEARDVALGVQPAAQPAEALTQRGGVVLAAARVHVEEALLDEHDDDLRVARQVAVVLEGQGRQGVDLGDGVAVEVEAIEAGGDGRGPRRVGELGAGGAEDGDGARGETGQSIGRGHRTSRAVARERTPLDDADSDRSAPSDRGDMTRFEWADARAGPGLSDPAAGVQRPDARV